MNECKPNGWIFKGIKEKKNHTSNQFFFHSSIENKRFIPRQELIENTFLQRFQGGRIAGYSHQHNIHTLRIYVPPVFSFIDILNASHNTKNTILYTHLRQQTR